jgi:hypothetical protein
MVARSLQRMCYFVVSALLTQQGSSRMQGISQLSKHCEWLRFLD